MRQKERMSHPSVRQRCCVKAAAAVKCSHCPHMATRSKYLRRCYIDLNVYSERVNFRSHAEARQLCGPYFVHVIYRADALAAPSAPRPLTYAKRITEPRALRTITKFRFSQVRILAAPRKAFLETPSADNGCATRGRNRIESAFVPTASMATRRSLAGALTSAVELKSARRAAQRPRRPAHDKDLRGKRRRPRPLYMP
ncbi:hypothetical protein EVAR_92426_1 [Eumeta japonica]|uniref:Uncharacterized protein n=1 Tax=Eumeta variegata TaxID=151549 RepID=A0A4C1T5T3_EUMVA|nr:hypothetical protein EVAR_92426_1 [Eumeta japonica]